MLETVTGLVDGGWTVVVTLPVAGPLIVEVERRGGRVVLCRAPVLRKSALRPQGFLRLMADAVLGLAPAISLIRSTHCDLVFVNTITIPGWLLLGRLLGRATVCHVHEAEGSAPLPLRRVMTLPVLAAHRILVNSRFSRAVLVASIPRIARRTTVVYNAVAGPPVVIAPRESLDGQLRLLYVGRLSPRKGPQVALRALVAVHSDGTAARLDLLGSVFPGYEWFADELHDIVRHEGMESSVGFLGFDPDIWGHLAKADIVLVPSLVDEPFGNTAVEAILAARPLVVSDTSGLREAASGFGAALPVAPGDTAQWVAAVTTIIAEWSLFRAAAIRDAEIARARHAPERYAEQIRDALGSLVEIDESR